MNIIDRQTKQFLASYLRFFMLNYYSYLCSESKKTLQSRIMIEIKTYFKQPELEKEVTRIEFVDFLYVHLDRFGDSKDAINKCIDYAFSSDAGKGGFLMTAKEEGKLVGALIMNNTGMADFIPEYILVYVAVDASLRGKGIGSKIIEEAKKICKDGDMKLHVEYDNPAKRLYERLGFTTKYAEMRLQNKGQ